MRPEYDFTNSVKNPYARKLRKQITIRIDQETIDYFKSMAVDQGIPYQQIINLYLRDCAETKRKIRIKWD